MSSKKQIEKLEKALSELKDMESQEKQHTKGKLTARERLDLLLDPGTFVEIDPFMESRSHELGMARKKVLGDAVVTGSGKIRNRQVFVYTQDFAKMGGSLGEMHGKKIVKVINLAYKTGCPIIGVIDSGGARIQEGIFSLDGYASIFKSMIKASGVIPQITVIVGPSAGGASYAPGLSDFVFMVENIGQMYITGPAVIKKVSGEKVSFEELGGAAVHAQKSGCCHFVFRNEPDCFNGVQKLLSYLPQNNLEDPPEQKSLFAEFFEVEEDASLTNITPEDTQKGYDMKEIIDKVFDKNTFFEVQASFARNIIVGFARLSGLTIGIVATQPKFMAGTLDIDSSDKIARFVRFCDCFNVPLINLVDTPGYLPGTAQEHQGIIRHGAKVLYAFAEASVPKIALILRKAFGGAYIALASRKLGYDQVIAWPAAQISVMGPEQAVKIIFRKEIAEAKDPKKFEEKKVKELREIFLDPFQAAKAGQVDSIINPKDTRKVLIGALASLKNKREQKVPKKHGNIPL